MQIGKKRGKPIHVLTEKLMAWNISQCKKMIRTAKECNSLLSVGHQRHYSMLYAHATEVVKAGVLGDIKYIRALWHRNFTWPFKADPKMDLVQNVTQPTFRDGWFPPVTHLDYDALSGKPDMLKKFGFDNVEQLIRWRLYQATGGGLMAELGSHQLDACSIFLKHARPLAVSGVGTRSFFGPSGTTATSTITFSPPTSSPARTTPTTSTTSSLSLTRRSAPTVSRTTANASWAIAAP